MSKVFDFSFTEGCWVRSFRVFTVEDNEDQIHFWDGDSVKVTNMGNPYEFLDEEDRTGVEEMLCWAFEERKRRKDSRDVCIEVDIETILPPE